MAEYTIELKDVVKNHNIFDFKYPFYDEMKRHDFEESFIKHFYFREICCPSIDRFMVYLNDKMNTVFPYYNELFKASLIDYDVLDNYKLTETYERNTESDNKQSGISSSVGKVIDEQTTETNENRTTDTNGSAESTGKDTEHETTSTVTQADGETKTETTENETLNGTVSSMENKIDNSSQTVNEKFLDTPQGLVSLSDGKYISSLKQTETSATNTANTTDTTTTNNTTTTNGTSDTNSTQTTKTDSERDNVRNSSTTTDTTGKETVDGSTSTTLNGEQRTTNDNNTRLYSNGKQVEKYTLTRRGNIGVDTDSQGIEKHIRLQKTLKSIERMFFDECEDLFMIVY